MSVVNQRMRGIIFLISAQTLVGLNIVATKQIVADMPFFTLLTIRFALATLVILPMHWCSSAREHTLAYHFSQLNRKDWLFLFAQALTAGALFNCFMLWGLRYTDANVAGIITSTLPAMIAIIAWITLKEKISGKAGLCILFATLGLLIITWSKLSLVGENHSFIGDFLILIALLPEAAYYVLCKVHLVKSPVFLLSAMLNAINAIVLLPIALSQSVASISGIDWLILIFLGLSTALFYVFWYFGAAYVTGMLTSLVTAVMPVSTVIFAWLLLNEHLTYVQLIGMSLVIFSIVIYAKK